MPLPPDAAIAGFAIAVLGWYALLRKAVSLIHKDIQDNKSVFETVQSMVRDVEGQHQSLQDWKTHWHVWEHAPDSMFEKIWGQEAYQSIKERLEHMQNLFKNAERKLSIFCNTDKTDRKSNPNRKVINSIRKKYLKVRFIWLEKEDLRELIEELSKELSNIQSSAKMHWLRERYHPSLEVDQRVLYHPVISHLLILIAQNMHEAANALHNCCREAVDHFDVELEVNLFKHTSTPSISSIDPRPLSGAALKEIRSVAIAAVFRKGCFVWSVLSKRSRSNNSAMRRLQVEPASEMPSDGSSSFANALTEVMEGRSGKCHFSGFGVSFSIEKPIISYELNAEPRQSLRQLLSGNIPPNGNLLGTISKFRLIFELSQACLVLLRTAWFTQRMCSCAIQCCRLTSNSPRFRYDFRLKMCGISHETPPRYQHWCGARYTWNFPTKALRRLGLSLVEIVLGTQILSLDVEDNDSGEVIGMYLGSDNPWLQSVFGQTPVGLEDVLSRVQPGFDRSEKCVEAIRYCLTTAFDEGLNEVGIVKTLEEVYTKVVEP